MRRRKQIAVAALVTWVLYISWSLCIALVIGLLPFEISRIRGLILYEAHHLPQAEQAFRDANRLLIPSRVYDWPRILGLQRIGHICYEQGKYADAETSYRQMLAILDRKPHREDRMIISALLSLGSACHRQGKLTEAERQYCRAIPILEKRRTNSTTLAFALEGLSDCRFEQKRYKVAEDLCRRSLSIERATGAKPLDMAITKHRLALIYTAEKRYGEATPLYKQALAIERKAYGPCSDKVARIERELGRNLIKQKKYKEAEVLFEQTVAAYAKSAPDSEKLVLALYGLGASYYQQDKYAAAIDSLQRALAVYGRCRAESAFYHEKILEALVRCYAESARPGDAEKYRKQLSALRQSKK